MSTGGSPVTLVSNVYDGYGQYPCNALLTGYPIAPNHHDCNNYGGGVLYRGNPTQGTRPAATTCTDYDITGSLKKSKTNGVQVSYDHSSQTYCAAPERMTPNNDATKMTSFYYNPNLDLTGPWSTTTSGGRRNAAILTTYRATTRRRRCSLTVTRRHGR